MTMILPFLNKKAPDLRDHSKPSITVADGLPFNMNVAELRDYAYARYGIKYTKHRKLESLLIEVYKLGSIHQRES